MVAVPILARAGDTIGVIVLHTKAPHEFTEDTLKLLVHIASLVSGAIENAQLYDQQRRRVDTPHAALGARPGGAGGRRTQPSLAAGRRRRDPPAARRRGLPAVPAAGRRRAALALVARDPEIELPAPAVSATGLLLAALDGGAARPAGAQPVARARRGRPAGRAADRRRRAGRAAVRGRARRARPFSDEDTEVARAIAHLAAIAIKRAELIEGLTNANIVKDLFEALAAGATTFAAAKAAEVRCDLDGPYLMVCAEPAGGAGAGLGRVARGGRGARSRAAGPRLRRRRSTPGPARSARCSRCGSRRAQRDRAAAARVPRAGASAATPRSGSASCTRARPTPRAPTARRVDAATIGRALLGDGGAIAYSQVGAYRYLVHIAAEDAPHDRMRAAVDRLIDYDRQAAHRAAGHARALPGRAPQRDRERARPVHPPQHAAPAAGPDRGAHRAGARRGRPAVARAGDQARAPARAPMAPDSSSSTTRNTGSFGSPANPLGLLGPEQVADARGCGRGRQPSRSPRSRARSASSNDLLRSVASAEHVAVGLDALAFEPLDRLGDDVRAARPTPAFVGSRPGLGSPNATPCTRAIVNTCTVRPRRARARSPALIAASEI